MSSPRIVFLLVLLVIAASPAPAPAQSDGAQSDQGQSDQTRTGETGRTESGATGAGQTEPSEQAPATDGRRARKQYLVEIVTFQYLGPDSSGGEQFDQLIVEEYLPSKPFDYEEYERTRQAVTYTQMKRLGAAREKLRLSGRYRVMTSLAWIQPLLNRNEAIDVPVGHESRTSASSIETASRDPGASHLSGSMRVYGDYLLFVDLDLRMTLPARPDSAPRETEASSTETEFTSIIGGPPSSEQAPAEDFETFRISEKRRIKLDELHYFDHPYFGAIVSVVRY